MDNLDASTMELARQFLLLVTSELDPYTKTKGVIEKEGVNQITLFSPSHIQFAKYGRGPGKKPPLDPILAWVKEKKVDFGLSERGTAFIIQKSIGENGTKKWKEGSPNALDEAVDKYFADFYDKVGGIVTVEINNAINQELNKTFPAKIKFSI